jgi:hypothetical protein
MAYYRLYMLSGSTGRFVGFEEFEAADDGVAIAVAEAHASTQALELWCGSRKVHAIPAREASPDLAQG